MSNSITSGLNKILLNYLNIFFSTIDVHEICTLFCEPFIILCLPKTELKTFYYKNFIFCIKTKLLIHFSTTLFFQQLFIAAGINSIKNKITIKLLKKTLNFKNSKQKQQ